MDRVRTLFSRLAALFFSRRLDREFDDEVELHLTLLAAENERRGMSPAEARAAARRSFGGVEQIREEQRERRGIAQIDTLFKDLRYAARMLARAPGFTLVAILTLALGIGINTTLFTAFNAVALKPLPVRNAGQVRRVERWVESRGRGDNQFAFSYPEYQYIRKHSGSLESLVAVSWPFTASLSVGSSEPQKARGQLVSDNYFSDFGVEPVLGRAFLPEEQAVRGQHPVVVLSYQFWQRRFLADTRVLGETVKLNNVPFTVVGVAPQEFIGTGEPPVVPDFWTPLAMQGQLQRGGSWLDDPANAQLQMLARVKPNAKTAQAEAETASLIAQFSTTFLVRDKTVAITLPFATYFGNTDDLRFQGLVVALMLVVGMVLAIACANLANMLLARAATRQREIAVRLAMGASRARLIRQLLTESILLALAGGAAGLLLSVWTGSLAWAGIQHALQTPFGSAPPLAISLTPDVHVFLYTLLISLVTGVAFGLAPALRSSKLDLTTALKEEGVALGNRYSRSRLRGLLVAGQVAVSMLLLTAAGLLARGISRSETTEPGFDARSVYWLSFALPSDPAKAAAFERHVLDRLGSLPEIASASLLNRVPFTGTWTPPVETVGMRLVSSRTLGNEVDSRYFETLGIPIERGRVFTRQEADSGAPVVVINSNTARQLWPDQDPIGKRLRLDMTFREQWKEFEVIGIARSVRSAHLSRVDPMYVYLPHPSNVPDNILIRIQGDAANALARVRATFEALDPDLMPSLAMTNLEQGPLRIERVLAESYTAFAVALALLALALATVGIYGVMSYLVSQRTREIGVMMALGADTRTVLRTVLREGMAPVAAGAAVGLAGGAGVSILIHSMLSFPSSGDPLYGMNMLDPLTFLGLPCLLAAIAMLASLIPVRRAIKVDPMIALRYD